MSAAEIGATLAEVAKSQLGKNNLSGIYGPNKETMWCADFASWCLDRAGVDSKYQRSSFGMKVGIDTTNDSTNVLYDPTNYYGRHKNDSNEFFKNNGLKVPTIYTSAFTPQVGDIMYIDYSASGGVRGHVMIVVEVNATQVRAIGGSQGTPRQVSHSAYITKTDARIMGYRRVTGSGVTTPPAAGTPTVTANKNVLSVNETITFTVNGRDSDKFYIRKRVSGTFGASDEKSTFVTESSGNVKTFSFTPTAAGTYGCYVPTSNIVTFRVNPTITANKTALRAGESITFTVHGMDSDIFYIRCDKDLTAARYNDENSYFVLQSPAGKTYTFTPGHEGAHICYVDNSNVVEFRVSPVVSPVVKPVEYIKGTKNWERTPLNLFLYYFCLGWIWMRIFSPSK
ncbi:MAG: CHAP domain-containing protein [Oscillospiraceae bacterium]|nr:CHAP domain-containing protein [Oscillospiraceae bacterium]